MGVISASLCLITSLFCGRITIFYARAGVLKQDFFNLILGAVANLAWLSSLIWFYLKGMWIIPVILILLNLFVINKFVNDRRPYFFKYQNIFQILTIIFLLTTWI